MFAGVKEPGKYKYQQLWQGERVFRDVKSLLIARPIFHQRLLDLRFR